MIWRSVWSVLFWIVAAGLPLTVGAQESYVRIESDWKPTQQINIETGAPVSSETKPGWWSADWVLEPVGRDQDQVRIKNRWKGTYLHLETGTLTAGSIQPGWHSARWVMESAGQGLTRFQNVWKGTYLNIQDGALTAGPIQHGWNSAMWRVKRGGADVSQVERAAATVSGAAADSPAGQAILASPGRQCVKAIFGIGYAAKVRWYEPQLVNYDPVTEAISLREGAKPAKEEQIAVEQTSCIQNNKKMFAQVSVIGGKFANDAITIATGTAVAITSGVAAAVACVGTVGAGCPAAGAAAGATVSGVVSALNLALPEAKETVYLGAPGKLEIWGTVWSPKYAETREYSQGKAVGATCSSDTECGNNTCAYGTATKGAAAVCCASGSKTLYAGYNYCTAMPAGSNCWSNYMCASGTCEDNMGGLQRGTCK